MPFKYDYYKCTRMVSVLVKCAMASIYLWVMLQAAAVIPCFEVPQEKNYWIYRDRLSMSYSIVDSIKEVLIYFLVFWMMFHLYSRCRCNFLGSRCISQTKNIQNSKSGLFIFMHPFMLFFIFLWIISMWYVLGKYSVVIDYTTKNGSYTLLYQFIMTVMFKMLVLTNFCSTYMRILAILNLFEEEAKENELLINDHDFGEHLNILFFV
ncbi:hypothetical protein KR026_004139 [Drosophila bipectinata]|nr:hypothetical protein KR026_004139 [Drosophila bipectinata]